MKYLKTSFADLVHSPGWLGKVLLLSPVMLIPIFGPIAVYGYAYGWARDIAWGMHQPMPRRILGNADGHQYSRGFFALLISLLFFAIPELVMTEGSMLIDPSFGGSGGQLAAGELVYLVGFMLWCLCAMLAGIGTMRMSIYGRLGPGLQLGRIWAMLRRDVPGANRVFLMQFFLSLAAGLAVAILASIGLAVTAGPALSSLSAGSGSISEAQAMEILAQAMQSAGAAGAVWAAVVCLCVLFANALIVIVTARAWGYWTRQLDVPHWRGSDEPMPFEDRENGARPSV